MPSKSASEHWSRALVRMGHGRAGEDHPIRKTQARIRTALAALPAPEPETP